MIFYGEYVDMVDEMRTFSRIDAAPILVYVLSLQSIKIEFQIMINGEIYLVRMVGDTGGDMCCCYQKGALGG